MRIPFTAPKVREVDRLSQDDRSSVMQRYASSPEAGRLIRFVRVGFIVSIIFIFSPLFWPSHWSLLLSVTGLLLLIGTFSYYRIAANRAIRRMVVAREPRTRAA
jgi:hypothetical protein